MMSHFSVEIAGRECFVRADEAPRFLLVQTLGRHERAGFDRTADLVAGAVGAPVVLAAFQVFDWALDLMPWPDPAISRDPRVGTMAEDTLRYVTDALLPALEADYGRLPVILGGYSLGGLFALWAASQTDRFAAVAAASPSLWIRGWLDFAGSHPVRTGKVYLSLGDREEHARNRSIARVGDCVRGEYELLQRQLGAQDCTLVWNPGGHFQDEDKRLAAAFGWCAGQLQP